MKALKIIITFMWFFIGLLFVISPLPITKGTYCATWLLLIVYMIYDIITGW